MSDIVIRAENLSKRYRLGEMDPHGTFREMLRGCVRLPARMLRTKLSGNGLAPADPNELWALKDVSFEVRRGEVVGVIGRNGAGKSTLLKLLTRITRPTTGRIELRGRVGSLLEVGTGFHPELTGRENIFLNGAILGMARAEIRRKFDEIVEFSGVSRFLDTPVKRYSSGMRVRLAFAVAAHLDPEILLIDEVLAVGDAEFQKKCLGKMGEVAKGGRTVLFVSHNMNAVDSLCSTAIVLAMGNVTYRSRSVAAAISHYLASGEQTRGAAEWCNSGLELPHSVFQPQRFFVGDDVGVPHTGPVRGDDPGFVYIAGDLHIVDPAFNVGYALSTIDGRLLYWSLTTDMPTVRWPPFGQGPIRLRSPIPHRWLNEGRYRVEMIASLHYREWIVQPGDNSPAIYIDIRGGLSDSPYWTHARPGALAPELGWEVVGDPESLCASQLDRRY